MTDDTAAPDPTPASGGRWRIPALVAALVLVIVVVVALASRGGGDETDPAADPTTSPAASSSDSPTPTDPPSASDSPTENGDPVSSPIIDEAVMAAMDDDFPALVPAGVPDGWTVQKATYSPSAGGIWRIDLTDADGADVQLVQSTKSVDGIVHEYLGADAQPAGQVNLSDYGTGKWSVYTTTSETGIAREISGTAALVVGPDQDTVVTLAQTLLTAEDADMPEAG